jgi:hypothetical protein
MEVEIARYACKAVLVVMLAIIARYVLEITCFKLITLAQFVKLNFKDAKCAFIIRLLSVLIV